MGKKEIQNLLRRACPAYRAWLSTSEVETLLVHDVLTLYGRDSLLERNQTYSVQQHLPDHLMIGQEGDRAYLLAASGEGAIYMADLGALDPTELVLVSPSFQDWLASGFRLPEEPTERMPLVADIYVNGASDAVTLMSIRRFLNASWPVSALRTLLEGQPFLAIHSGYPNALGRKLKSQPQLAPYLFYADGNELRPLCIESARAEL